MDDLVFNKAQSYYCNAIEYGNKQLKQEVFVNDHFVVGTCWKRFRFFVKLMLHNRSHSNI